MAALPWTLLAAALTFHASMAMTCMQTHEKGHDHLTWNCSDLGLPSMAYVDVIPSDVEFLDLSHNRLEEVTRVNVSCSDTKRCDECLKRLHLDHNSLSRLHPDAFERLVCLEELDLSHNQLTGHTFDAQTFQGLYKLRVLQLHHNPLGFLPDFAMLYTNLLALQHLDLSHAQLSGLAPDSIDDLLSLVTLDLSHNLLPNLTSNVFTRLHLLEVLNLTNNRIAEIGDLTFGDLFFLKSLDLSFNQLAQLPDRAFLNLNSLKYLTLRGNRFPQLPYRALAPLGSLETLDSSQNLFRILQAAPHPQQDRLPLTSLIIDLTSLKEVGQSAFAAFPLLRHLQMTHNHRLKVIHPTAFAAEVTGLEEIYLDDNALASLPQSLLPWEKLKVVSLENNLWQCDCQVKWMLESQLFNQTLTCATPAKFHGRNMLELPPSDLTCPRSMVLFWALGGALVGVVTVGVVVVVLLVARADPASRLGRCLRPVKGAYVSVFTKEQDGQELVRIAKAEEEVGLREVHENDDVSVGDDEEV